MTLTSSGYYPIFASAEYDHTNQEEYEEHDYQTEYDNDANNESSDYDYTSYDAPSDGYAVTTSPFDDAAVTDENSDLIINILSNDRAYYGDKRTLTIDQVYEPSLGTLSLNADGSLIYSPSQLRLPANSAPTDTFFYTASFDDDSSSYYSGQIKITINQINDVPRVIDSMYTITENQEFSFYLKAYDEDNNKLTFLVTSDPTTLGYFVLDQDTGLIIYTSDIDFTGEDFITYVVSDGIFTSDPATVSIFIVEEKGVVEGLNDEYRDGDVGGEDDISYDYYDDYYNNHSEEYEEPATDVNLEAPSTEQAPGTPSNSTANANDIDIDIDIDNDNDNADSDANANADENAKPVAEAGGDQGVLQGEQVDLDGLSSYDPDGDTILFAWSQILGPTVTLINPASANPTFISPVVTSEITIIFELVVSDGLMTSDPSFVTISVVAAPDVQIDILPNIYPNNVNINKEDETIPVAIFGSNFLDVTTDIDEYNLSFGPNSAEVTSQEVRDVNHDAFDDLIAHFTIGDLGLQSGHTQSCLSGSFSMADDPVPFESCDSVRVVNQNQ